MSDDFFRDPVLNSPYELPTHHWELDEDGQPTTRKREGRRSVSFVTPIPKPRKRQAGQGQLGLAETTTAVREDDQKYELAQIIDSVREAVSKWRGLDEDGWGVTPETARLLRHWRHHEFSGIRPFFCQLEAVETVIWLTEAAPRSAAGRRFIDHLDRANATTNGGLGRLALKLATGAGKTTVMAMLIAWQTINAARRPGSRRFTRGFLVVTPGLTVKDRLRVLQPNDPGSYYRSRELVPNDMLGDLGKAQIVITNYHAFKLRETMAVSKGGRSLLQGRGPALNTEETEGQMLQRVMPGLMGMKNVLAFNDEAHHCYRENPGETEEGDLRGEDRREAKENREAARLWMSGLEIVERKLGLARVVDLSATPFFLRGSGYAEGTLFPWTMSDFSLMDAIECGIVKLPRVPVVDNIPNAEMPVYRELWKHIGKKMPKPGGRRSGPPDPRLLPPQLQTALEVLYHRYEQVFELWQDAGLDVHPCFIVVCNNTATSKLVHDYIAGFLRENADGSKTPVAGKFGLFSNFDENGEPRARRRTLLIDSRQLESGDALDRNFRAAAADEIERFRREIVERTGDRRRAEMLTDQDLLREAMNTVGKPGHLGAGIRCVVSVSMLTEGWDTNTVTHVLGVRAFGTQLLCEQVVGRALRRQSYELNDRKRFDVEYADVLGIPFDFTAKPVDAPPPPPVSTTEIRAVTPERDACEIRFPRVSGYRVVLPETTLRAEFNEDSTYRLTPEVVGPTRTTVQGIAGESANLNLDHTADVRLQTIAYHLAGRLLETRWRDGDGNPKLYLFGQLKSIVGEWLDNHLECVGDAYPAQILYPQLAEHACDRIQQAIDRGMTQDNAVCPEEPPVMAVLDPYNPSGSTRTVRFRTTKTLLWDTRADRCHLNHAVCDSHWEREFCRIADDHPRVLSWVKNQGLGFEVPYRQGGRARTYIPDFIVLVDDGVGIGNPMHLVVEVKGDRNEDAKDKKATMETYWVRGVNRLGDYGRWDFEEFTEVSTMEKEFSLKVRKLRELTLGRTPSNGSAGKTT